MADSEKKILIVDDSETSRMGVVKILRDLDFDNIVEAENGQLALDLIREFNVSLILLDVYMPVMNGLEMCKELKTIDKDHTIPIVVLSSDVNSDLKSEFRQFGAVAWMVKPYTPKSISILMKGMDKQFKLKS